MLWTARSFALKYAPERRAQGALCREKDRERETSSEIGRGREREKEGERTRSCATDGMLARALNSVPERRAQSALCREKDKERET